MTEINSAKLIIEFVNQETGELFTREATLGDFKEVKKTTTRTKKSKDDGSTEPKVLLLDGKIQLNSRAVELCGWEPEAKIDIRFDKKGKKMTPVMGEDPSKGNRLTKTYTISCRGSKHDNLKDFDELYYNIIGTDWDCNIDKVTFKISMPSDFDASNIGFSHGEKGTINKANITF